MALKSSTVFIVSPKICLEMRSSLTVAEYKLRTQGNDINLTVSKM